MNIRVIGNMSFALHPARTMIFFSFFFMIKSCRLSVLISTRHNLCSIFGNKTRPKKTWKRNRNKRH